MFFVLNEESTLIKYQRMNIDCGWTTNFVRSISSKDTRQHDVLYRSLQVKEESSVKYV